MNTGAAVSAVHTIIDTSKATLVTGISHQGYAREIAEILKSVLTPPKAPYSVVIDCTSAEEYDNPISNAVKAKPVALYTMEVTVTDIAYPQYIDPNQTPYETMHQDFRKLCDRMVRLLKDDTIWMPDDSTDPRYRVMQSGNRARRIEVQHRTAWFDSGTEAYPMLIALLRFVLAETCVNTASLYL